ncbi:putative PCF11 component of pre-mRNA 3'-end processing factor CF I [Cercophora samala]|uniref:PCF11 component of pre-mRNA 3'-end processing factor CF I n=1 Tax=Cercophora samala TaxID=330535 RepID=A0AA40DF32_9PEZI|nr:putative PCF11 component of pre-mRNA 3'-end processing factor CF I [Cercophora samala]
MDDHGDEVAADFREALQDLTTNARFEIVTLTNIARENADHGLAISEVLTNHIKEAPASKTLPALYVLDSIVKNVPTPYALYFGPKLYQIFMGSYTKVDNATRRKMDEMLKTWKEPVAGSISKKPVFPLELVRPIENALLAARNAYMEQTKFQNHLMRGRPAGPPARDTPTPPMGRAYQPPPGQPPYQGPPNGQYQPPGEQAYPVRSGNTPNGIPNRATPPQPAPSAGPYAHYQQPPHQGPYGAPPVPGINIDKLKDDIQQLIELDRADFAQNMHDASKQNRLKALLDLQKVIQSQNLPQDQLMIISDQVAKLAVNMRVAQTQPPLSSYPPSLPPYNTHTPTPPVVTQQFAPPPVAAAAPSVLPQLPAVLAAALGRPASNVAPMPVAAAPPPVRPATTTGGAPPGTLSLDAILGQGALAALLAAKKPATPQQTFTPVPPPVAVPPALAALRSPPQQAAPFQPPPPPAPAATANPLAQNPAALLAMLRQSGLLGGTPAGPTPPPAMPSLPPPDPNIITLTPSSLKLPRQHLRPYLFDHLGPPCSQCGRRFPTTEEGRKKKTQHMDWHFRVHQRVAEAEQRGQHRSQFVSELDWIQSHEEPDVDYNAPSSGGGGAGDGEGSESDDNDWSGGVGGGRRGGKRKEEKKKRYIIAPDESAGGEDGGVGAGGSNKVCPICQEKFQSRYLEEVQDWVWMDAVVVGQGLGRRVFHGSCWDEVNGGSGGGGGNGGGQGMVMLGGNNGNKRKMKEEDGGEEEEVRGGIKRMMR